MPNSRPALDRVLPTRSLFRGHSLVGLLLSTLAALMMAVLLFCGVLVVDLFVTKGELTDRAARDVAKLFVEPVPDAEPDEEGRLPTRTAEWAQPGANRGLLPTAARLHAADSFGSGLVNSLVRNVPPLRNNMTAAVLLMLGIVGTLLVRALLIRLAQGQAWRVALETCTRLRRSLHRHSLRLGPSDLRNEAADVVLHHFTVDVDEVGDYVRAWTYRLGRHPVELLVLFVCALCISPLLALQCLIPLGGCWYLVQREMIRRENLRELGVDRAGRDLKRLAESLRRTRVVRGYGMENHEHEQFGLCLERYQNDMLQVERGEATSRWAVRMLVAATLGCVLYLVGYKILALREGVSSAYELSLAGAAALLVAFGWMAGPLDRLWRLAGDREHAAVAADAVQRYLDVMPEVSQAVGAKFLEPLAEQLRFEGITYRTKKGELLLSDFNCTIRAGDVVALVSLDPVPARAVGYLLPRFIEPTKGRILFDGEDAAWVTLESLRAESIFVGEGDLFFTDTVFQNIACGQPNYQLPDVTEAAKIAHAHNFVQKLPSGYETVLGEQGEQLDAGQAFRLSLARAVLRDPALLIVEEPSDKIDKDTKALVDDAYDRIFPKRTVLLLPTRLTTLRRANRVIVIQDGKVVADGHHEDLVKSSAVYRHWEYTRFNEFSRAERNG